MYTLKNMWKIDIIQWTFTSWQSGKVDPWCGKRFRTLTGLSIIPSLYRLRSTKTLSLSFWLTCVGALLPPSTPLSPDPGLASCCCWGGIVVASVIIGFFIAFGVSISNMLVMLLTSEWCMRCRRSSSNWGSRRMRDRDYCGDWSCLRPQGTQSVDTVVR